MFGSFVVAAVAAGATWQLWSRRPSTRNREAELRRFGVTLLVLGLAGVVVVRLLGW